MEKDSNTNSKPILKKGVLWLFPILVFLFFVVFNFKAEIFNRNKTASLEEPAVPALPQLDFAAYDKKLIEIANNFIPTEASGPVSTSTTSTLPSLWPLDDARGLWPVKTVYPNAGAILPFSRIVAYYGNLYSKNMGVLGEHPEDEMLRRLQAEVKKWETADPTTPVVPALHYIAVVAQRGSSRDGKYRLRMPESQIEKVLEMAEKIKALVFLDVQVGRSNLQIEVPLLEKYLKLPNVHLGIDPEYSMKTGAAPGSVIGTLDAEDINFAANYLAKTVKENDLTPKVLVVHRFTQKMVTNYKYIKPLPEVQLLMNMDGFGGQANKLNTYKQYIYKEPVQFTGFKLFYKNDTKRPGSTLLTPEDLLKLTPIPVYIQYQ